MTEYYLELIDKPTKVPQIFYYSTIAGEKIWVDRDKKTIIFRGWIVKLTTDKQNLDFLEKPFYAYIDEKGYMVVGL